MKRRLLILCLAFATLWLTGAALGRFAAIHRGDTPGLSVHLAFPGLATSTAIAGTSAPPLAWTPSQLTVNLSAGASKDVTVTATAQSDIKNASVRVVPALAPFLSVSPSSIPSLAKG